MRNTIISGLIVALWSPAAFAAGWTQPEGAHYFKVWNKLITGENAFLSDGKVASTGGTFTDLALGLYYEYGFSDGTTIIAHGTPIGWSKFEANTAGDPNIGPEGETTYIGPINFGVRRALYRSEAFVLSAQIEVGYAPRKGEETVGGGLIDADECERSEPCGFVYRPAAEHGRLFGELQIGVPLPNGFWLSASAGGGSMLGITEVLRGFFQVGWASSFGLVVDFHATGHTPFDDPGEPSDIVGAGVTRYIGIGPGISYWFNDHWGINVGAEGVAYAESNLAAASLSIGIEHK